jgi:chemotaxis signal transduction protein
MMSAIQELSTTHCNTDSQPGQALLVFPVAQKWFGLPLESVRAVLTADLLRTLAGNLDNLAGWLELEGQEVLVLDMTQTLVPGADNAPPQQIILLRVGDSLAALITAGTSETISIPASQVEQTWDSAQAPGWALGICRADGRTITVLDPQMFVSSLCPSS